MRGGLSYDSNFADSSQVTAERGEAEALAGELSETLAEVEAALGKLWRTAPTALRALRRDHQPGRGSRPCRPPGYCIACASRSTDPARDRARWGRRPAGRPPAAPRGPRGPPATRRPDQSPAGLPWMRGILVAAHLAIHRYRDGSSCSASSSRRSSSTRSPTAGGPGLRRRHGQAGRPADPQPHSPTSTPSGTIISRPSWS